MKHLVIAGALVAGLAVGAGGALLLRGDAPTAQARPASAVTAADPAAAAALPPVPAADRAVTPDQATDPDTALRGFLAAEASGAWERSYGFLVDEARRVAFPSMARWVNEHANIPRVVGYRVDAVEVDAVAGTAAAETLTGFDPVVDPVLGLVAARGRTSWRLEQDDDGLWRVDPSGTANQPLYPSDQGVAPAARAWVDARVACAEPGDLEAGLVGSPPLAELLCSEDQAATVALGTPGPLSDSDAVAPLLTEFGPEVFTWARTIRVEAATPFTAVLGPVGQDWKVLGILPAR